MQRSQNRRRRRRRSPLQRYMPLIVTAVCTVAAIIIAVCIISGLRKDVPVSAPVATILPTIEATAVPTPEPTAVPTPEPTPEPLPNAVYRPGAKDGWLPVFRKAETDEKMIAITVDDCFQAENLAQIVQTALECGGKLTIFPIGDEAAKPRQTEILRYAWQNGMELENHTYTHSALYNITDEALAQEIYRQNLVLSNIVGQEYQAHFVRPRGGDARNDQRIHAYAKQIGYAGIAHWSLSGANDIKKLKETLTPGAIYLFHTTDKDLKKLVEFIPFAVSQGYRLVTLNEMFGYPANEVRPLSKPIEQYEIPPLQPYDVVPVTYKQKSYAYGVVQLQQKLIAMGYLEGSADGVYGETCAAAVSKFQAENGFLPDGVATPEVQSKIDEVYKSKGSPALPPVGRQS